MTGKTVRKMTPDSQTNPLTIGVTGTKGKTSTVHFIAQLMEQAGRRTALDSTTCCRFLSHEVDPCVTAQDIADLMALACHHRIECVVLEVTSRVATLGPLNAFFEYDCAVFTTFDKEHLDYHRSVRNYLAAKQRLPASIDPEHDGGHPKWVVLNCDDPAWEAMRSVTRAGVGIATFSARQTLPPPQSVWHCSAQGIRCGTDGTVFNLHLSDQTIEDCRLPLYGYFNVQNALAAIACACLYGLPVEKVVAGLARLTPPDGRFAIVNRANEKAPWIVVDYAHTTGSLQAALNAARKLAREGRVICVFGCGGDCYKGKRPEMGRVAAELGDSIFLTSDNPRAEDPHKIIREIRRGVPQQERRRLTIEPDRRRAIEAAVSAARAGDVVLIAGRGHEKTQNVGGEEIELSDADVALTTLARLVDPPSEGAENRQTSG